MVMSTISIRLATPKLGTPLSPKPRQEKTFSSIIGLSQKTGLFFLTTRFNMQQSPAPRYCSFTCWSRGELLFYIVLSCRSSLHSVWFRGMRLCFKKIQPAVLLDYVVLLGCWLLRIAAHGVSLRRTVVTGQFAFSASVTSFRNGSCLLRLASLKRMEDQGTIGLWFDYVALRLNIIDV
jgi:hypothetical protein